MSVLLNAVTKLRQAKKLEKKKKLKDLSKKVGSCDSCVPVSNESTLVWFWKLNGVQTTVVFSKEDGEVWCNGYVLPTEIREEKPLGMVVEFLVELEEKQSLHKCKLVVGSDESMVLMVDGNLVPKQKS